MDDLPASLFYHAFHFTLRLFFLDGLALVKCLLAFCQADHDLGLAADKVYLERNKGIAFLGDLADELADLFFMKQEFACPERLVVHNVAVGIGADAGVEQKHLAVLDNGVTVRQVREAQSQRLYLRALERHSRFKGLFNEVIVVCLAVCGDRGICFILCHGVLSFTSKTRLIMMMEQ